MKRVGGIFLGLTGLLVLFMGISSRDAGTLDRLTAELLIVVAIGMLAAGGLLFLARGK